MGKNDKKKVYLVTSGVYSDYNVDAVFTKKHDAEMFAALRNEACDYSYYRVEEYFLDQSKYESNANCFYVYEVNWQCGQCWSHCGTPFVLTEQGVLKAIKHQEEWGGSEEDLVILADRDDEKAEKIAEERIARKKANEAGISN